MANDEYLAMGRLRPAVEPCWMCGIRLPVSQMVADGGSACGNLRWYCFDVRGCTERWTTRTARPVSGRDNGEEASPAHAATGG